MLITTKTPLRVSFMGGGTDYPEFFNENFGCVLGTTIDLHVYISKLNNNPLSTPGYKLNYRKHEEVSDYKDFSHPVVREVLRLTHHEISGLSLSTLADVPARSGLGSSSSFTVGLLKIMESYSEDSAGKSKLAIDAINVERRILQEPGGWQDQFFASYGGFNFITFAGSDVVVNRIEKKHMNILDSCMVLCSTQEIRKNSNSAHNMVKAASRKSNLPLLTELSDLTRQIYQDFTNSLDDQHALNILSYGINESWKMKLSVSEIQISTPVENIFKLGKQNGAKAAKLCGSGDGGFILFIVQPDGIWDFINKMQTFSPRQVKTSDYGSSWI